MRNIIFIYDNTSIVSNEISEIIGNYKKYGDIIYKKESLSNFISSYLKKFSKDIFVINEKNDYKNFLSYIKAYEKQNVYVVYLKSNILFNSIYDYDLLIEKITTSGIDLFVDIEGSDDKIYGLHSSKAIEFIDRLNISNIYENDELISLKNENYLLDISRYESFVKFLQTKYEVRYFNAIEDDGKFLIKKSNNIDKIKSEFFYYTHIPDRLKVYFPFVCSLDVKDDIAKYSIEKFNIPDLSLQYISNSFDKVVFSNLVDNLFTFLKERKQYNGKDLQQRVFNKHYKDKVQDRLKQLKSHTELYRKINTYIANGTQFSEIDDIYNMYFEQLRKVNITNSELVFSHGDLCFSNILFDRRLNIIKLIDPKGDTNLENLYLDSFYDIAKLSHSILGLYDFINNGLYEIKIGNDINLELKIQSNITNEIKDIFKTKLIENNFNVNTVRLLEVSLFLSMLPLHVDNFHKVLALLINGMNILLEIKNGEK